MSFDTEEKNMIRHEILSSYQLSFANKTFITKEETEDILMNTFSLTNHMKKQNKQYWNRELGKCWEKLVISAFENLKGFGKGIRNNRDEICDLVFNEFGIDTKYCVGSGDSGTLKKFKLYGEKIKNYGKKPVMLFLRDDNLPSAITAIKKGGWRVITGEESLSFIQAHTGFDLKSFLEKNKTNYSILT